jgi:hypothetical protein
MPSPRQISFEHNPTVYAALMDDSFVTGIVGPVGSGKSVGGCSWCMKLALEQEPDARGIRPSRIGIIRNTTPELRATTIKTWLEQFPEGAYARIVYSSPITYYLTVPARKTRDGIMEPGIAAEFIFVGLDKPKDVRRLLSLELTAAWVNEAREIPKAIIDALVDRIGRYPPVERVPATRAAIFMDTNPCDDDHWWYRSFEVEPPSGVVQLPDGRELKLSWSIHHQPAAVLELEQLDDENYRSIEAGYPAYRYKRPQVIEAAGRVWGINPKAENLPNLRAGYYHQQLKGKKLQHIQAYQQGKYVYVQDGKPVVPEYAPEVHGSSFPILEDQNYIIGVDIGGGTLQPSAVIIQKHPLGNWLVQSELVCFDIGVDRFLDMLKVKLMNEFHSLERCDAVWLDPASEKRDEIFETKVRDYFVAAGFPARAAPTQDVRTRIDAISAPCSRMFARRPGLLVSKARCPWLHKGLSGAWYYRRKQVSGAEIYADVPEKNEYSHVCEALGYGLVGGGEYRVSSRGPTGGVHRVQSSYRIFAA